MAARLCGLRDLAERKGDERAAARARGALEALQAQGEPGGSGEEVGRVHGWQVLRGVEEGASCPSG